MIQFQNDDFTVFESQLFKTLSVVVVTNDCVVVVDPSLLPSEVEEIRDYVNLVKGKRPIYLIFTHSDWDHVVGAGAFPDATVIASYLFNKVDQHQILEQIKEFDHKYYLDRNYNVIFPHIDIPISREKHSAKIGVTTLTFYQAPGHTQDGIFTVIEPYGILIAGDYLSDIEFPFIYDNSYHYELTLQKLDNIFQSHSIRHLVPGHGHMTSNKTEMVKRKEDSLNYIKELRNSIIKNKDTSYLLNGYQYRRELRFIHEENIVFMKRELNKK